MLHPFRLWLVAALLGAALSAQAAWLKEVEIRAEPVRADGQRDYAVRLLPAETHAFEDLVFEFVYHQEFPWEDHRGRKTVKIHEPVTFSFRRHDVKLVNDLDTYVSIRVPASLAVLQAAYGKEVFNEAAPVTIPRLRIRAIRENAVLWEYELKTDALHRAPAPLAQPARDKPPAAAVPEE